jgi:hypothetical protein
MKRTLGIILVIGMVGLLAACGSDADKLERGIATDPEVAVPESEAELDMTETERRSGENEEEEEQEAKLIDESQM